MRIGIVVPVYKTPKKYLDECIQSIVQQTYKDIQVVLVDDCSPDDCGKWCEEYAARDARFKVVHHKENKLLPGARNTGLDSLDADVEWVTFVDSDDWIEKDTCERFVNRLGEMDQKPDVMIFSGYESFPSHEAGGDYTDKLVTWSTYEEREHLQIEALSFAKTSFYNGVLAIDTAWGRFLSMDFIRRSKLYQRPLPYREDGMFFQETVEKAQLVAAVPDRVYHYRQTNGSMVNRFRKNGPAEQKMYMDMLWDFAKEHKKSAAYMDGLYTAAFVAMQVVITQHFFNEGNKASYFTKQKQCAEFFKQMPFCDVLKHVSMGDLRKNQKIKYACIRMKWYAGVALLRTVYMKLKKEDLY